MTKHQLTLLIGVLFLVNCVPSNKKTDAELAIEKTIEQHVFSINDSTFCSVSLDAATLQLDGFRKAYLDPTNIPRSYKNNNVRLVSENDWTSGFVAGSFWRLFEHTQDPSWRKTAEQWTSVLEQQKNNKNTHDVGFMIFNSYGNGHRLSAIQSYQPVIIQAAESLMTRYDSDVGAIRSWSFGSWEFPVIIDNMMNLELLYFAFQATNNIKFSNAATTHALTTLKNHFRADGSSFHLVNYDPVTGMVIKKQTHQGIADNSSWSRGQAWGLYGFTMVYRFTQDVQFLTMAEKIADYYLNHPNLPDDKVPYFDFDAPSYSDIENNRDASAAAITASALLELSGFASGQSASRYRNAALTILKSLSSPTYSAKLNENGHFLLMHSVGHHPQNSEINVAINYADYYYLEALQRCTQLN